MSYYNSVDFGLEEAHHDIVLEEVGLRKDMIDEDWFVGGDEEVVDVEVEEKVTIQVHSSNRAVDVIQEIECSVKFQPHLVLVAHDYCMKIPTKALCC